MKPITKQLRTCIQLRACSSQPQRGRVPARSAYRGGRGNLVWHLMPLTRCLSPRCWSGSPMRCESVPAQAWQLTSQPCSVDPESDIRLVAAAEVLAAMRA